LCRWVKGPDFPTGGQILNSLDELKEIYKTGSGSIRLRGSWDLGPETRSTKTIYIDSIPYTVNKAQLVERIAEVVLSRKLPQLLDVKDLSTEDVRIALELKKDADEKKIMARFRLDAEQTDAILELKIYRLARLEILIIRNELEEKRKRARHINALLKDEDSRWKLVRTELEDVSAKYGDKRRTSIASDS